MKRRASHAFGREREGQTYILAKGNLAYFSLQYRNDCDSVARRAPLSAEQQRLLCSRRKRCTGAMPLHTYLKRLFDITQHLQQFPCRTSLKNYYNYSLFKGRNIPRSCSLQVDSYYRRCFAHSIHTYIHTYIMI